MVEVGSWTINVIDKPTPDGFSFEAHAPDGERIASLALMKRKLKQIQKRTIQASLPKRNARVPLPPEPATSESQHLMKMPSVLQKEKLPSSVTRPPAPRRDLPPDRPKRQRLAPLEFWAGERVIYQASLGGPQVAGVIRTTTQPAQ